MDFFTYILEDQKGNLYIGQTANLEIRLKWHNMGNSKYTKNKGPWKLIFSKKWATRTEASKFEIYLKSLKNPKYIRKQIIGSQLVA